MLISSKEKTTLALYHRQIRNKIRRELIEQQIIEAEEIAAWCLLIKDQESLKYFYQEAKNWRKVLSDYDKLLNANSIPRTNQRDQENAQRIRNREGDLPPWTSNK